MNIKEEENDKFFLAEKLFDMLNPYPGKYFK